MNKKNILIISPFFRPNIGGVESHLDLLTKYLTSNQNKVVVLTYKPITTKVSKYLKVEKSKNLTIYRYWWFGQKIFDKTTPFPLLQFIYIIPGLLFHTFIYLLKNKNKIDVIHSHGFASAFITRLCCLGNKKIRLIVSTHYLYPNLNTSKLSTKILKWTFQGFDQILAVSKKSNLQLQQIGINPLKIKEYKHWLDPKIYKPAKKIKNEQNKLKLLFVGRIIKMKGVYNLLYLAKINSKVLITLIGDGPDYQDLKKKSQEIKNFKLKGKKNQKEIIRYYQQSDFTILPSLSPEAQPMVVMESLMSGTPVITTNKGSVSKMYSSSVGLSISPTKSNLNKKISSLMKKPDFIAKLKRNSRPYALKNYGFKNAKIIINSYNYD